MSPPRFSEEFCSILPDRLPGLSIVNGILACSVPRLTEEDIISFCESSESTKTSVQIAEFGVQSTQTLAQLPQNKGKQTQGSELAQKYFEMNKNGGCEAYHRLKNGEMEQTLNSATVQYNSTAVNSEPIFDESKRLQVSISARQRQIEEGEYVSTINFSGCSISDSLFSIVVPVLLRFSPCLEFLNLSNNYLESPSAVILSECLNLMPRLKGLNLRGNQISDIGCISIVQRFFGDKFVFSEVPATFADSTPPMPLQLSRSLLASQNVDTGVTRHVAGCSASGTTEENYVTLDLSYNAIGPKGFRALGQAILCHQYPTRLYLRHVECNVAAFLALVGAFQNLVALDVSENPILCSESLSAIVSAFQQAELNEEAFKHGSDHQSVNKSEGNAEAARPRGYTEMKCDNRSQKLHQSFSSRENQNSDPSTLGYASPCIQDCRHKIKLKELHLSNLRPPSNEDDGTANVAQRKGRKVLRVLTSPSSSNSTSTSEQKKADELNQGKENLTGERSREVGMTFRKTMNQTGFQRQRSPFSHFDHHIQPAVEPQGDVDVLPQSTGSPPMFRLSSDTSINEEEMMIIESDSRNVAEFVMYLSLILTSPQGKNLETLSISGNSLSDTHLQFLCNFMKPSPAMDHSPEISLLGLLQLEYLDLSNNHIMNIDPLLPLLEHTNCKLRHLDLSNNQLNNASIESMCEVLMSRPSPLLYNLSVAGNQQLNSCALMQVVKLLNHQSQQISSLTPALIIDEQNRLVTPFPYEELSTVSFVSFQGGTLSADISYVKEAMIHKNSCNGTENNDMKQHSQFIENTSPTICEQDDIDQTSFSCTSAHKHSQVLENGGYHPAVIECCYSKSSAWINFWNCNHGSSRLRPHSDDWISKEKRRILLNEGTRGLRHLDISGMRVSKESLNELWSTLRKPNCPTQYLDVTRCTNIEYLDQLIRHDNEAFYLNFLFSSIAKLGELEYVERNQLIGPRQILIRGLLTSIFDISERSDFDAYIPETVLQEIEDIGDPLGGASEPSIDEWWQ